MSDRWEGWHYAPADMRLRHGDGREIVDGETLTVGGAPALCDHGLHASRRALDALCYALSHPCACRVWLDGKIVEDDDKAVATVRGCEWHLSPDETERVLSTAARQYAADVWHLWRDECPEDQRETVERWLVTGDESLRAAAWRAAWEASWAAREAAREAAAKAAAKAAANAARDAVANAAWAARDASWAARAASWATARDAAGDAAGAAAQAAAWAADGTAQAAARDAQNDRLERWLVAAHEGRWDEIVVTIPEVGT